MGQALRAAVGAAEGMALAATFDVGDDYESAIARCNVIIDFTRPEGTMAHLAACRAAKKKIVIGTTGFAPEDLAKIQAAATEIAIVKAPNMSVGVVVTAKLVEMASRSLGPDYDVEVFEMHHKLKVDAPSGTALMLGEVAAKARGTTLEKDAVHARHGTTGERKAGTIGFSTARGGDVVGDHTVFFAGVGERIEITHRSNSRATYAQGALRAARFLAGRTHGLYSMEDVLGLV
ncbi:4-hydroxy-tetrahydrodipicolinate reductase [Usitatibacter palustris]